MRGCLLLLAAGVMLAGCGMTVGELERSSAVITADIECVEIDDTLYCKKR